MERLSLVVWFHLRLFRDDRVQQRCSFKLQNFEHWLWKCYHQMQLFSACLTCQNQIALLLVTCSFFWNIFYKLKCCLVSLKLSLLLTFSVSITLLSAVIQAGMKSVFSTYWHHCWVWIQRQQSTSLKTSSSVYKHFVIAKSQGARLVTENGSSGSKKFCISTWKCHFLQYRAYKTALWL